MKRHTEYLRRNLLHAKAVGANAGLDAAINRLCNTKRHPRWLVEALLRVKVRIEPLPHEIALWRNSAKDRPK